MALVVHFSIPFLFLCASQSTSCSTLCLCRSYHKRWKIGVILPCALYHDVSQCMFEILLSGCRAELWCLMVRPPLLGDTIGVDLLGEFASQVFRFIGSFSDRHIDYPEMTYDDMYFFSLADYSWAVWRWLRKDFFLDCNSLSWRIISCYFAMHKQYS